MDKIAIKDAATIILIRDRDTNPRILMGQRGSKAAFMPNKYVFPGGAIENADHDVPLGAPLDDLTSLRLAEESARPPSAIAIAAIRELHGGNRPNSWHLRPLAHPANRLGNLRTTRAAARCLKSTIHLSRDYPRRRPPPVRCPVLHGRRKRPFHRPRRLFKCRR